MHRDLGRNQRARLTRHARRNNRVGNGIAQLVRVTREHILSGSNAGCHAETPMGRVAEKLVTGARSLGLALCV